MHWVFLIAAGVFEVAWAILLTYTHGFTRLVPSLLTVACIVASMGLLGWATRAIPIGTAYAIWVGIGAFGTAAIGMIFLGEAASPTRLIFLALLLVSVVGLKLS